MNNIKIGFIGCGNIANAIIHGSVKAGYIKPKNLIVFDTDETKLTRFTEIGAYAAASVSELVNISDYVFLTIKPQIFECVLPEISNITTGKCFISVAAGITIDYIKLFLGKETHIIRAMPNTPLMFSEGATAIVKDDFTTENEYSLVKGIFECSGIVEAVSEDKINLITAISGSAPAFVMQFAKCMIDYAEKNGLERSSAENLILQVFYGTANMVKHSDDDISKLIKNVTSPNGTTEAGLNSLNENNFRKIINQCLDKTVIRAEELTK